MEWIKFIPRKLMSRWVGALVSIEIPVVTSVLALIFAKIYHINLDEAEKSWSEYPSIQKLFTRKLKYGVRPVGTAPVVHPADSEITSFGKIQKDILFQAKGLEYTLKNFTCDDQALDKYENGFFVTYYLCPTDYHRVHSPVDGKILSVRHIVGDLWPVNKWSVNNVDQLFCVNERVNIEIQTQWGIALVSLVGAANVGQISLAFDPEIRSNILETQSSVYKDYQGATAPEVFKGDELGQFNMGSTVIVLYPQSMIQALPDFKIESSIQSGKVLLNTNFY